MGPTDRYLPGQYFGELALLKDTKRAATITALRDVKAATIDRDCFKRLLGPLETILERNIGNYTSLLK
jgi:cAMP-dependent protein kinase regulator